MNKKAETDIPDTKKLIIQAAEQYGFNLEFKTCKDLDEDEFTCELNKILPLEDRFVEIDLVAKKEDRNLHLIIECKGAAKDTYLVLIKAANNRIGNDAINHLTTRHDITDEIKMPIFKIGEEKIGEGKAAYTITGDFFRKDKDKTDKHKEQLTKISKNEEQNNFYKAQKQILDAMIAYSRIPVCNPLGDKGNHYMVPLIVTNADIWVIDYNKSKPEVSQVKGVLHRVTNDFNKFPIRVADSKLVYSFAVPVVNYQYIDFVTRELVRTGAFHKQIVLDLSLAKEGRT